MFDYDVATVIGAGSVAGLVSAFLYNSLDKARELGLQFFHLFVHSARISHSDWRIYKCVTKWVDEKASSRIREWSLGYNMSGDNSYADRRQLHRWVEQPWVWIREGRRFYLVNRVRLRLEVPSVNGDANAFIYYYVVYTIGRSNLSYLMKLLEDKLRKEDEELEDSCTVTIASPSGELEYIRSLPMVTFEDVLCPHAEAIVTRLNNFLSEDYRKRLAASNMPHKMVILLYGPPGNGKSTAIRAIATHLRRNIALLTSENFMSDRSLMTAMNYAKGDIAVLEDVDAMMISAVQDRTTDSGADKGPFRGASMSALLNLLDGAITPDGSVVILTTNHIDKLDPALLRPGRVDMKIEFGPPTPETVSEMLFRRYGERPSYPIVAKSVGQVSAAMRGGETLQQALELIEDHPTPVPFSGPYGQGNTQAPELLSTQVQQSGHYQGC